VRRDSAHIGAGQPLRRERQVLGPLRLLTPQQQRELSLLFEQHWAADGQSDIDGLAKAIARWAFERELVYLPNERLRREGCVFYPITADGQVVPLWLAHRKTAPS
jgi:hypothetical protein